jgi:putative transposase
MIDHNSSISVRRQCDLLGIPRSVYYYVRAEESEEDKQLMRLIDEQYLKTPFYGARKISKWLNCQGYCIGRERAGSLMKKMGLSAIYQKPKTSISSPDHKKYPYLLKNLTISEPNQVWCTDITYIRLKNGFVYLVAIMDWFSRYVLSWQVSNSLETSFCLEALNTALMNNKPEIFNSDQGIQFTSDMFTGTLSEHAIRISMDGRGSYWDNIFIERLWKTVKYEEVYINDYERPFDAMNGLTKYFYFYNNDRIHQSLNYETPAKVYYGK